MILGVLEARMRLGRDMPKYELYTQRLGAETKYLVLPGYVHRAPSSAADVVPARCLNSTCGRCEHPPPALQVLGPSPTIVLLLKLAVVANATLECWDPSSLLREIITLKGHEAFHLDICRFDLQPPALFARDQGDPKRWLESKREDIFSADPVAATRQMPTTCHRLSTPTPSFRPVLPLAPRALDLNYRDLDLDSDCLLQQLQL